MAATDLAFVASLTIFLLLSPSRGDDQIEQTISEICQQTDDFNFCSTTFHQNLPFHPDTIPGLVELTHFQALANVTETLTFVKDSLPQEKNPTVVEMLKACADGYNTVMYSLEKSLEAFRRSDYKDMAEYRGPMLTEQSRCYEIFNEAPYQQNQIHEMSREVKISIAMVALAQSYLT